MKKRRCPIPCDVCPMSSLCDDMGLSVVEIVPEVYDNGDRFRLSFSGLRVGQRRPSVFRFRTMEGLLNYVSRIPVWMRGTTLVIRDLVDEVTFEVSSDIVRYADSE